jgi:hypothetical protein
MKNNVVFTLVLIVCAAQIIFSQGPLKNAESNPLDCAMHLLIADPQRFNQFELFSTFYEAGRYDEAIKTLEFEDNGQLRHLVFFTRKLVEDNKTAGAKKFLDRISLLLSDNESKWDADELIALAPILIRTGRTDEAVLLVKKVEDEEDRVKAAVGISRALLDSNYPELSLKTLEGLYEIADSEGKAGVIELYARLKQKEKAEKLLADFEPGAFIDQKFYSNRPFILFSLINANLALGKIDRALELWQQYGKNDVAVEHIKLIDALSEFGYKDKSLFYLNQIAADKNLIKNAGADITERLLKLNDINRATAFSKQISDDIDSYEQQKALMAVADKLIEDGKTGPALEILDFAFQRAKKIVYEHGPMDSVGASSGSRKEIYLGQIYERLVRLEQFDKAFAVFNAIGSDQAKDFVARHLVDFAGRQIETLPRKKIYEYLKLAQDLVTDEEADVYDPIEIKLLSAEVYARMGEKDKAVKLIAAVLEEALESCCYERTALISAGKIFEKYKLRTDACIRKVLREYITEAEN